MGQQGMGAQPETPFASPSCGSLLPRENAEDVARPVC